MSFAQFFDCVLKTTSRYDVTEVFTPLNESMSNIFTSQSFDVNWTDQKKVANNVKQCLDKIDNEKERRKSNGEGEYREKRINLSNRALV